MALEAFVWDKDGVLVDTESFKAQAHKQSLERYGVQNCDDWYYRNLGAPGIEMARMQIQEFGLAEKNPEITPENLIYHTEKVILPRLKKQSPPNPIQPAIDFLRSVSNTYKQAVASSDYRSFIKQDLQRIGIFDLFQVVVSGAEDVANSKPAPDVYIEAAKRLGVNPSNCLAIEDTPQGIESAKKAGMRCVSHRMPHNHYLDLSQADLVVNTLSELSLKADILPLFQ